VSTSLAARLIAFVKLGRPLFLVGGFVLYALGAALAVAAGGAAERGAVEIDWRRYLVGQLVVTLMQLATHYSNDYFDLEADRANATPTRWSGGSRVLLAGALQPRVALVTALVLSAGALLAAVALASSAREARLVLPLALAMLVLSWAYSAPPARLCARGLGELTTAVVVTLLVPLYGFYLQARAVHPVLLLGVLPPAGLQFAMLLAIEFPDAAGDAAEGKRTLVVGLGPDRAARLYVAVVAACFLSLPALAWAGLPVTVAAAGALPAPIAAWQAARVARGAYRDPARWESLAFVSVALLVATSAAELVGALLVASRG
jgi:1,4-dihydroxy-2-naphthoate octaprenyltransferase